MAKLDPSFAMMGQMGFDATALRKYTTVERIEHTCTTRATRRASSTARR
jgi:hypothetical protein